MPKRKADKAITDVMESINEAIPGALYRASDEKFVIHRVPTGVIAFDKMIGGGIPCGFSHEWYGLESVLKSTMAAKAVVAYQAEFEDQDCIWVDAEGSFDSAYMEHLGVDLDRLQVLPRPATSEAMVKALQIALRSNQISLIVVDSVAALMPQRETEYDPEEGEKAMGSAGKANSAMMRRITSQNKHGTTVILINQTRVDFGVRFGSPDRPTGGKAIGYYAGERIEFRRGEVLSKEIMRMGPSGKGHKASLILGRVINVRVVKDKTGPYEGQTASILWNPNIGEVDENESLLLLGIEVGSIKRASAAITLFPGIKKREVSLRGWDVAKVYIRENPKVAKRLRTAILA